MVMNILFSLILYPVIFFMWIGIKHTGKNTKKYVFGVTLTKEQKNSEEVQQIIKEYNRDFWIIFFAAMWEPFLAFAFDRVSIQFTIWMIWFLAMVVLVIIPYAKANVKTLKLKGEEPVEESTVQYVELKSVRTIKFSELIYPVMLSLVPPIYLLVASKMVNLQNYQRTNYWVEGITYLIVGLFTIALVLIAFWMDKRRTLVINGDSDVNLNYSRAMKKLWKKVWLTAAYMNALVVVASSFATIFEFHSLMVFILMSIAENVVLLIMIASAIFKQKAIEEAYESKFEIPLATDQDRNWKYGMFYYNKHDKNTLVEKRFGIGTTMNMATKAGVISEMVGLLALLWIPFFCVYMIAEDYTPTHLIYEDNQVICKHLKDEYVIDVDDIVEATVVDKLPEDRMKTVGTATDYIEKGEFRSKEDGIFKEFVIFSYDVYLKITTNDTIYYVNGNTAEETYEVYEFIK